MPRALTDAEIQTLAALLNGPRFRQELQAAGVPLTAAMEREADGVFGLVRVEKATRWGRRGERGHPNPGLDVVQLRPEGEAFLDALEREDED